MSHYFQVQTDVNIVMAPIYVIGGQRIENLQAELTRLKMGTHLNIIPGPLHVLNAGLLAKVLNFSFPNFHLNGILPL
jgi:hypothetical protein